jgi:polyisoprenoid-binding protein YceI
MKTKILNLTGTFTATLLLALLTACGPATPPPVGTQEPATNAAPVAATAPAAAPAAATPAGAIHYDAQPTGSKMKIEGTSNIHDWTEESSIVAGSLEADAKFPESALTDASATKPVVQVSVPVRSLKSGNKRMDTSTYDYLKQPEFKNIEYRLLELKPKSAAGATGSLKFDAVGALTIVGVTRTNTMPVTIEKSDGKLKVIGSTPVKCTDYGLKPFSFLGIATCGDDLKISFEWLLAPKAP